MKVTRKSVFETNSSSTHSICIASACGVLDKLHVDSDGVVRVCPGEYGWEEETYTNAATKASYCLTYCKTGGDKDGSRLKMLRDVIQEATGAKSVEFLTVDGKSEQEATQSQEPYGPDWGGIDHQSHFGDGDACGPAFESADTLRRFIFSKESVLTTDNDNH